MDGLFGCSTSITSKLNQDLDSGTGSANSLVGFANSVISSGSYAGIASASHPLIKGNVTSTAGTMSLDILNAMETKLFNAAGILPDVIMMDPATHQSFTKLNLGVVNVVQGVAAPRYNLSVRDDGVFWKGVPVLRDKDQTAGTIKFISLSDCHLKVVPPQPTKDSAVFMMGQSTDGAGGGGLPIIVESMAKTGPSVKISVRTPLLQFVVTNPRHQGYVTGVV